MPPITSFVKVSNHSALPVRIFISRKAILNNNLLLQHAIAASAAHNNKAIVRLHKTSRITLSNADTKDLLDDCKEEILKICFDISIEELLKDYSMNNNEEHQDLKLSNSSMNKNKLVIPIKSSKGWKTVLVVHIKYLEMLRFAISNNVDFPRENRFGSSAQLLVKDTKLILPKNSSQDDEFLIAQEENEEEQLRIPEEGEIVDLELNDKDTKKGYMKTTYSSKIILGKGVDLMVLSRA
ncbi:hypothetical protein PACTADRAFT_48887 [Pachysolen tannophilus NRRL Y-2460]|uniref:Uncharacterized protein n=1 Tax=Pachysolen tannophilus NRRL Y-2460 TaxID=669874 RepID=A0A1E4TZG7_PACTA|nr:hypothetical protein PACTADRAFT_48887 [Pachysolen tannophilus NRRL Y-2460]